ncbi:hypothetical protein PI27_gp011 [Listeria phage WIL-1]|nr:hypothetical protein PI27_gp011 [Listeria phage WIL-1]
MSSFHLNLYNNIITYFKMFVNCFTGIVGLEPTSLELETNILPDKLYP